MRLPLSILDLVPIARGQTVTDAFAASVAVARRAEELGYTRVWYAEHHNMPTIASAATSVVIAHIGAHTSTIRLGAGGIMLPNHSPLTIAEQFGALDAMYPHRIDLGLGRAPGSDQTTFRAMRRDPRSSDAFPQDVQELQAYLAGSSLVPGVDAIPGKGSRVPLYMLGSSLFGAQLAAALGLPYAFASHFAPDALFAALAAYRSEFKPSAQLDRPYAIVGVNVTAADTAAAAREQFHAVRRARAISLFSRHVGIPPEDMTDEQADELLGSAAGLHVDQMLRYAAVGTPGEVSDYLDDFRKQTEADEFITVHQASEPGRAAALDHAAGGGHAVAETCRLRHRPAGDLSPTPATAPSGRWRSDSRDLSVASATRGSMQALSTASAVGRTGPGRRGWRCGWPDGRSNGPFDRRVVVSGPQPARARSSGRTSLPIISIAAIGSADITWMETRSAPTSVTSGR